MKDLDNSQITRMIRQEISRQLNVILHGSAGMNDQETETINEMFPGMPGIDKRPVMHPYGFVSRAVQGTISVIARVGEHIGNRMVLGHRDKDRPVDIEEGESVVYSMGKYQVRILNGKIQVGKDGDFETVVAGETLRQLLISLIQELQKEQHIGNLGFLTGFPSNSAQYELLKVNNLDNKKILSEDGGRYG